MESINAANIYHFILKPWDPTELRPHCRAAAWSATGSPPSASSSCATWRAKNADLEATLADLRAAQDRVRARGRRARPAPALRLAPARRHGARQSGTLLDRPGDWREATVLFADIRGYTRLIETTPGPVVIRLLDGYLNEMIEVIFRHQGTVEQLIGDEIVVLFGVTEDEPGRAGPGRARGRSTWWRRCGRSRAPLGRRGAARASTSAWASPRAGDGRHHRLGPSAAS